MNETFDATKPIQTREGGAVRIIATDARGPKPIIALLVNTAGDAEQPWQYLPNGRSSVFEETEIDLVNI